jgi:polyhydroxyalkanoate synthase
MHGVAMTAKKNPLDLDSVLESVRRANEQWLAAGSAAAPLQDAASRLAGSWQAMLRGDPAEWRRWLELGGQMYREQFELGLRALGAAPATGTAAKADRRFDAPEWTEYPLFDYLRRSYEITSDTLLKAVETAHLDDKTRQQMRFYARQFVDAMSPANFALTNPEVLKLAAETKGESFAKGYANLLKDLEKGRISLSADTPFEVGRNLANTPGEVVFENELIQLIQYRPTTPKVKAVPLLLVPSVVNKFYILDLSPETSLVRYLVGEGFTVFLPSWRNISAAQQHLTWDDYVEQGVLSAIDATLDISGQEQINAAGYCTGGALLASALAVRAALGERPVASMTLLMTMLEFSDPGEIGVYLDPLILAQQQRQYADGGVVPGRELTLAFSSLRANDLIWSFVVNNYLKGKTPAAFDLLYWNTDDSNLPGPMFSSYLKNCYVDNRLVVPDALTMCGVPVDLRRIDVPAYVFGASEDHLVPWKAAYESVRHLGGEVEFVLGAGGHVTGPINPVTKNKRSHWIDGGTGGDADAWRSTARAAEGSWWRHWSAWLQRRSGASIAAPKRPGNSRYRPIEPAPGRYVMERLR